MWPRLGTPYEIVILISSMYVALVLGIVAIRLFRCLITSSPKLSAAAVTAGCEAAEEGSGCPYLVRPACKDAKPRHICLK